MRSANGVVDTDGVAPLPESDFWKRLVAAWSARKLPTTQLGVARKLDMSQGSVQQWVRGTSLPTLTTAVEIAVLGKVCVEWLLTGRGPQYPDATRGDPWLDAVCEVLRDYPEPQRPRLLEFLVWQSERNKSDAPQTLEEAVEMGHHAPSRKN